MDSIFDSHCHIGNTMDISQTPDQLLNEMNRLGVKKAIICPMGRHIVCKNKEGNNLISETVRKYPDRFIGFACINPWFGEEGVDELKRAVSILGLKGLKLHPSMQGFQANDHIVYPLIKTAEQLKIPIYIHSGTPTMSLPLQILDLAKNFSDATFILGHMGGADFFLDVQNSFHKVNNVYLETSITCHSGYVKEAILRIGIDRIIFGSNSPISDIETEIIKIKVLNLNNDEVNKIMHTNLEKLLKMAN
ncbi:MAG: amidohydrolase family protein, partial [Nitrososphaeraceae archaeon]|nr:amidohydrolase family protein [Nitrososphaeraceae archaeon]